MLKRFISYYRPERKIFVLDMLASLMISILGLTFPMSYIGGQTIGPDMLHYDAAAGETLLQSPLVKQMFQPQNSEVIQNLFADRDNFMIFRLFLYVAVPIYILIMFALENFNRRNYGKDVKKHRSFRIGRRLLLSSENHSSSRLCQNNVSPEE